jgi:two-component system, cell cycle sensor histidine kinase and response regulator CckA
MTTSILLPDRAPPGAVRARWSILVGAFALMTALFILDLQTPIGLAVWLPYMGVILLTLGVPGRWPALAAATGCSALTMLGLFWPATPEPIGISLINRSLAVVTFWLTAFGGLAVRRSAALRETNQQLLAEIEDRKRAEAQVREQASLLDIAHDAISVRDLDDRIIYWNRGAERLYGWRAEEVIGRSAVEMFIRGPAADLAAARRALLDRGEWTGASRHTTKDGREVLVETRWTLVRDDAGRPRAKLVVNTDVTERRRLEAQVLRTQRLESVGVLAGGIAHDFNNLLTPMLMAVKLLREDRPADERTGLLATLQAGAERGAELVRKLLSFAGGGGGERGPVGVTAVVREIEGITAHTFPKSIRLNIHLPTDLRPVLADATQLSQVVLNLCVNARDAMPDGGTLTITAAEVTVGAVEAASQPDAKPGEYVRLDVADTGHGIPPEILDRVFDPFFTTKKAGQGTGLGLSTVLGIVRSHGGFLTMASQSGAGTRFAVYWPVSALRVPEATTPVPGPPRPGDGSLVLVVDDEAPILHAARATLEAAGYQVATARDGQAALDLYRSTPDVKAVVLDVMMPGLDGGTTLAELRKLSPGCRVLLASGLRLPAPLAASVRGGEVAFLPKPYTADQLLTAVGSLTDFTA